jgi:hypothetical protein
MCASFLRRTVIVFFMLAVHLALPSVSAADEVLDWNTIAVRAMQTNTATPPASNAVPAALQPRLLSIVHMAIFDAVNGIDRRFGPIRAHHRAPRGASRSAAAVWAAYTVLNTMFPAQGVALFADLTASLVAIPGDPDSIQAGRNWGTGVAMEILASRSADGFDPSPSAYVGSMAVGKWRPTPRPNPTPGGPELAGLNGQFPWLGQMEPFVIRSPLKFRSEGPPRLSSREYARDLNEVKSVGELGSLTRNDDQTQSARFWSGSASAIWNRAAATAARRRHLTLLENARLFALLNIATADAIISCWDAKYHFELWRPITAIRLADTDGNSETVAKTDWTPLIVTPPYPEYDSGHQSISGSAQQILTAFFGKRMRVESYSEVFGTGVVRTWRNFAAAADEAFMARIWAGIHFRFAMEDTRRRAEKIANYVLKNGIRRRGDDDHDDDDDDDDDDDEDDDD